MFRKNKRHINYKMDNVIIRPASLDEEYEVGRWSNRYSWIKISYLNMDYKGKYSDIIYVMTINNEIAGYFMAYNEINITNKDYIPLYGKELILYDFALDAKAYSKYSKILIDYMLKYATYNGYNAITFNKINEHIGFNQFIKRNYKPIEAIDKLHLIIDKPRIASCQRHLTIYENDVIQIDDLYFLYDLCFDVLKTKCRLKLNNDDEIIIDRKTGLISLPKGIKLINDNVILNNDTKSLIYLIAGMYHMNDIKPVTVNYDINNPNYYEAIIDNMLYVSKNLKDIDSDKDYINSLIERGYDRVVPNHFKYNMNERSFSNGMMVYRLSK